MELRPLRGIYLRLVAWPTRPSAVAESFGGVVASPRRPRHLAAGARIARATEGVDCEYKWEHNVDAVI